MIEEDVVETMEMSMAREHVAGLLRDAQATARARAPRAPRASVREEAGAVARGTRAGLRLLAGRTRSVRPTAARAPEVCCA